MPPQNPRFFGESYAHIVLALPKYLTTSSQYLRRTKTVFTLVYHFVHILSISVYGHFLCKNVWWFQGNTRTEDNETQKVFYWLPNAVNKKIYIKETISGCSCRNCKMAYVCDSPAGRKYRIRSWISVWTAVLTVREHLTECLKNAIKPHQVNIGKTKDEMGKGIEVEKSKI